MTKEEIRQLLHRYRNGLSTERENKLIDSVYEKLQEHQSENLSSSKLDLIGEEIYAKIQASTDELDTPRISRSKIFLRRFAAAASIAIICVAGWLVLKDRDFSASNSEESIAPGFEQAILSAPDGIRVDLGTLAFGDTLRIGNTLIHKNELGEILHLGNTNGLDTGYHEITVPRGGKFNMVLPDGTKVWLNADSYLKYASNFRVNRQIDLTGEAYFEVKADSQHPFRVSAAKMNVQVLGTSFNVRAYPEDEHNFAYVQHGAVEVTSSQGSRVLAPTDFAKVDEQGGISVENVNADRVLAWKDEMFHFDGTAIEEIANQIERWYDVDVNLDPEAKGIKLYGVLPRTESANQLFEILEATNTIKIDVKKGVIHISKK